MGSPSEGLLLLTTTLKPVYASPGSLEILTFPEKPNDIRALDSYLTRKIKTQLLKKRFSHRSGFAGEFTSGRRRYTCRAFYLNAPARNQAIEPSVALLIERNRQRRHELSALVAQYHLTQREQEAVEYLIQGLTSKEIGVRMHISPNTVKAFLRIIMVKVGATTRSGIIGKILLAKH